MNAANTNSITPSISLSPSFSSSNSPANFAPKSGFLHYPNPNSGPHSHEHRAVQRPQRDREQNSAGQNQLHHSMRALCPKANAIRASSKRSECLWWTVEAAIVLYMLLLSALWLYCTDNLYDFVDLCAGFYNSAHTRLFGHASL